MPQTFIQEANTPKRKTFIEAYLKEFKPKNDRIDSPVSAAQGYDSVYLLAAAITQAGSTEGPKVRAALENLNTKVEGVVMVYDKPFTHGDHDAITAEHAGRRRGEGRARGLRVRRRQEGRQPARTKQTTAAN